MESLEPLARVKQWAEKYKYALMVILLGLGLMVLPTTRSEPEADLPLPTEPIQEDLEEKLESILCKISGAGKVEVLLSIRTGEQTHYQTNIDRDEGSSLRENTDTVLVDQGSGQETGLVSRTDPPVYLGAVVVCQGAGNAQVRLAIVEAVKCATGLGADAITVVKMESS